MKTLYLVRHAKSSWEQQGIADEERPIIKKGIKKTKRVIAFLKERNVVVGLMISSQAVRALETARRMARGLKYPEKQIRIERKIYDGYFDRILDLIYKTPDEFDSLMIIGHNPTITHLANLFLHPGIDSMTTSAVVCISFNTDHWEKIPNTEGKQEFIFHGKKD